MPRLGRARPHKPLIQVAVLPVSPPPPPPPGTLTVTAPVASHGYRAVAGVASIPVTGTYTGGPVNKDIEARFNGGSYSTIATGSGGAFSGTLAAQAKGKGSLDVRFVNDTTITASVASIAIGRVIVIAGQSNATGQLTNLQTGPANSVGYHAGNTSYTAPGFWGDGNDPLIGSWTLGSPWPLLATHLLNDDATTPIIWVETAIGGRSLVASNWYWTKFRPDTGGAGGGSSGPTVGYGEITASITSSGAGGVDDFLWYQGESDVDGSIARNVYADALGTFATQIAADVTGAPKLAVVMFGHDGSATPVAASAADAIKLAMLDEILPGTGNFVDGVVQVGDFSNALHVLTNAEGQKVADRMFALLKGERGPRCQGVTHNAARTSITVSFDKVLKTGLTHTASLWGVTGNGSNVAVSSVAYHATDTKSLVLTLGSAASLPILVSFAQGGSTSGKVWPLGPDYTLPGGVGTTNQPAEPFASKQTIAQESGGGAAGALLVSRGFTGGVN